MALKLKILLGTIRADRKSEAVAKSLLAQAQQDQVIQAELIDLKDYPFPVMEQRLDQLQDAPAFMQEFSDRLEEANGILIVAPEYKNSYPGALKNAFDFLKPQVFKHIPVGICSVSSGGFGGINCLAQLRLLTLALGGVAIPEKLPVSKVNDLVNAAGEIEDEGHSVKEKAFIEAMKGYMTVLKLLSN